MPVVVPPFLVISKAGFILTETDTRPYFALKVQRFARPMQACTTALSRVCSPECATSTCQVHTMARRVDVERAQLAELLVALLVRARAVGQAGVGDQAALVVLRPLGDRLVVEVDAVRPLVHLE